MDSKRLFVALWPSAAVQRELAAVVADEPRGVPVRSENLHLTLAFLGNSNAQQEACYRRALASLAFTPIMLDIHQMGFWREPRILWTGPKETPAALIALVENLHALLQSCGFVPDTRPFRAHITLKRKYPGPAPDWGMRPPVRWLADTVALVWSQSTPRGVSYQPLLKQVSEIR
ncbi:MAG: RNA 2',3'-cyclic phosphodiesterase [Proteobacteria bacterium]|nr:RNA 2',3'-cyclic phosphodiesterase [Pseudomonadota bacterium]MCL2307404.1 RNA 2',3'-cyclic phosphodiesterase [Pseudomonadota bacterium]